MDSDLEQKVESWKAAKEAKDFATADQIRSELRAAGYDPDRPRNTKGHQEASVNTKIQQWRDAKASKDFATADAIRAELRSKGVEPDPPAGGGSSVGYPSGSSVGYPSTPSWPQYPPSYASPFMQVATPVTSNRSARPYDPDIEAELDQWLDARSQKDYSTADSMRESLRARGISPQKERPGGSLDEIEQWRRAKEAKDFQRSDRIRAKLRESGIEPEKQVASTRVAAVPGPMSIWPTSRAPPSTPKMDSSSNHEVSQWYAAKDRKDFATADTIRSRLRSKGIEPADCPRPKGVPDSGMEGELEQWFAAKDEKNWAVADRIRERLRAQGIEPATCQRPSSSGVSYGKALRPGVKMEKAAPYSSNASANGFDSWTENKLDQWWKFKQDKNYSAADAIRAEMRELGIEPDQYRPRR